jgi:hypothetical protein
MRPYSFLTRNMSDKQGRDSLISTRFIMLLPHSRMNFAHMRKILPLSLTSAPHVLSLGFLQRGISCALLDKNYPSLLPIAFFRFVVKLHRSLGYIQINIPTPSGVFTIVAGAIQADIPLLIGLETLDANRLQGLTLENKLQHVPPTGFREPPGFLPLLRRGGHIHLPFKRLADAHCVHFFKHQLTKRHRQMYHPRLKPVPGASSSKS